MLKNIIFYYASINEYTPANISALFISLFDMRMKLMHYSTEAVVCSVTGVVSVIGIKYESPGKKVDDGTRELKVKSFVPDTYKDQLEDAARF